MAPNLFRPRFTNKGHQYQPMNLQHHGSVTERASKTHEAVSTAFYAGLECAVTNLRPHSAMIGNAIALLKAGDGQPSLARKIRFAIHTTMVQ